MKSILKISKLPQDQFSVPSLKIQRKSGEDLGLILCSGEFLPVDMVCLTVPELLAIVNITENFNLFHNNL